MTSETEQIFVSPFWGNMHVYTGTSKRTGLKWVSIYCKVDEVRYRYFMRDWYDDSKWEKNEVDWNGFLLGGRSLRLDFELDPNEEITQTLAESLVQSVHDVDDVPRMHVEKVFSGIDLETVSDKDLWTMYEKVHARKGEVEKELRDLKRDVSLLWEVGSRKYDWADKL